MINTIPEGCKHYATLANARAAIEKANLRPELISTMMVVAQMVNDTLRFFPVINPSEANIQDAIDAMHRGCGFYIYRT